MQVDSKMDKENATTVTIPQQTLNLAQEFINWHNDPHRILHFHGPQQITSSNFSANNSEDDCETNERKSVEECILSRSESNIKNNVNDAVRMDGEALGKYDPSIDDNLPPTVKLLTTLDGGKLYLVGTAHFSIESQNDVAKVIRAVQPHIVMVELCKHRIQALQLNEETLFKESQNIGIEEIRTAVKTHGLTSGLVFIILLIMSRHVAKELGMAPGSEFRTALYEASKVPNCVLHLGDRPFNITMQRAFQSLSLWQKIKCGWKLLTSRETITKEDVEKCKNHEILDAIIEELTNDFPPLAEVFIKERDLFLTYSLQLTCQPRKTDEGIVPTRAVGVVGIGHMPGIVKNWGKVHASEIQPIMKIPPPSLSSIIIRTTVRVSVISAAIYIGYKIIPLPYSQIAESLKSSVNEFLKVTPTR